MARRLLYIWGGNDIQTKIGSQFPNREPRDIVISG